MEWLNYHHLLYFWMVAREGGVAKAAQKLRLAHPTVISQVHTLEASLGEKLFVKQGRRLVLTEMGHVVYGYADEIFALGGELLDTVKGRPTGRPQRLVVGIPDVVPKLMAKRLLDPVLARGVRVLCREDDFDRLLSALASHDLDVVISDSPLPPGSSFRAFNHVLGESGVQLLATKQLATKYRRGFPRSIDGAPMLLPAEGTSLRRSLDQWFDAHDVRPDIRGEFEDRALMKVFAQDGHGIFPYSAAAARDVERQYGVRLVGPVEGVRESYYAISIERRIKHPAVQAIFETARTDLFGARSG
jgi:LysR family transcriptional activator of nhaA